MTSQEAAVGKNPTGKSAVSATATAAATIPMSDKVENPSALSLSEAQEILDEAVRRYYTLDIDTILSCFSPDVIVNYGNMPEFVGHDALREFLSSRFNSLTGFELTKTARCVMGNIIGIEVDVRYSTGGKNYRGRSFEFVSIEKGLVSKWDNVSITWEY